MILQLNPPIPIDTPRGPALAHFLIDDGPEHHLQWVVALDRPGISGDVGECWQFENPHIRFQSNYTIGRVKNGANDRLQSSAATDAVRRSEDGHP